MENRTKIFKEYYYFIVFLSIKTQKYHRWKYQRIEKYCRIIFFLVIIIYDYSNFNRLNMGYDTRNESKKKQKKYERHKSNVLVKVVRAKLSST